MYFPYKIVLLRLSDPDAPALCSVVCQLSVDSQSNRFDSRPGRIMKSLPRKIGRQTTQFAEFSDQSFSMYENGAYL
jgi:hypothetical protein